MDMFSKIKNVLINSNDSLVNGFPKHIRNDVEKVVNIIPIETCNNVKIGISENNINYILYGEKIIFPYRIYYNEISESIFENLNEVQKNILHCIYTRSCDGYVREKHLGSLLNSDCFNWVIPYIVKICDEYVVEILELTYSELKERNTDEIKKFCIENKAIFCKSYNRMISYWNEFYRHRCYYYKNYIGRKLFRECFGYTRSMEKI